MKNRVLVLTGLCVGLMSVAVAQDKNIVVAPAKVDKKELSATDILASSDMKVDASIMFVETFTVMGDSETGMLARKEIEAKRDLASQEVQVKSKDFEKAKNEYITKATTMSDAAREKEEKNLIKKERDLKNFVTEKEEELKLDMQMATEKLAHEMEAAVIELAQQENIDVVFDKMTGRAIYVSQTFDFTDKVIERVNEKHHLKLAQNKKDANNDAALKIADNKKAPAVSAKASA
jgi:Skp family chaperone for outer membrane proteins